MTKIIKTPKENMEGLYNETLELVKKWNEATLDGKGKTVASLTISIDEIVPKLKKACQTAAFAELKKLDDPMFEAVKNPSYQTYRIKNTKNKETGITTMELVSDRKFIKLVELDKYCGGIGKDSTWKYMAEKLHFAMLVRAATELGVEAERVKEIKSCYAMNEIVKQTKLPGKDPVSNRSLVNTMQSVVEAVVGADCKTKSGKKLAVTNHDRTFMLSGYMEHKQVKYKDKDTKEEKLATNLVKICDKKDFITTLLMICNNRYEEKTYDMIGRDFKDKEK